jgi:hypothetical protein
VAKNGDELFETSVGTGSFTTDPSGGITIGPVHSLYTITGGTGRFDHAAGRFHSAGPGTGTVLSYVGGVLVFESAGQLEGEIAL